MGVKRMGGRGMPAGIAGIDDHVHRSGSLGADYLGSLEHAGGNVGEARGGRIGEFGFPAGSTRTRGEVDWQWDRGGAKSHRARKKPQNGHKKCRNHSST